MVSVGAASVEKVPFEMALVEKSSVEKALVEKALAEKTPVEKVSIEKVSTPAVPIEIPFSLHCGKRREYLRHINSTGCIDTSHIHMGHIDTSHFCTSSVNT